MKGPIYTRLENFNKTKYPYLIKKILKSTGYDSEYSLKTICEKSIETIEKTINENRARFNDILEKTVYDKTIPFSFLLGHKVVILSIPKDIERYKQSLEQSKTVVVNDLDALKPKLLKIIKNHMQKKKLFFPTTSADITNLSNRKKGAKCVVQCTYCNKKIPCTYTNNWNASNFLKHLCAHKFSEVQVARQVAGTSRNTENSTEQLNSRQDSSSNRDKNSSEENTRENRSISPTNTITINRAKPNVLQQLHLALG